MTEQQSLQLAEAIAAKFNSSLQHILAELARLDLLIRVQVWRLRQVRETDINLSPFYIPEEEIDAILSIDTGAPLWVMTPLSPEVRQEIQERLVQQTAVIAQQKAATEINLRLDELTSRFQLTPLDRDLLLIALAPEIDLRYARLYAYLQDNVSHKHPSVNLALSLLFPYIEDKMAAHRRLTPAAPLRHHQLLYLIDETNNPHPSWLDQGMTLDNRIVRYLLDGNEVDGRLTPTTELITPSANLEALLLPADFAPRLAGLVQQHSSLVLYFQGPYGVGKQTTADALCQRTNQRLLVVNGEQLLNSLKPDEFAATVRLIDREARLQGAALFWDAFDTLLAGDKQAQRQTMLKLLAARPGLTFLSGNTAWEPDSFNQNIPFVRLAFPLPEYGERDRLWQTILADETADTRALANKFRSGPFQ